MRATLLLALLLSGCVQRGAGPIPEPYPRLETPEAPFELFGRAARQDDPQAAYHCLSPWTTEQLSFSDFVTGWTLYQEYFELFGKATIIGKRAVPDGVLLQIRIGELEEPFLVVRTEGEWRLELPSRHNTRSLEELFGALQTAFAGQITRPPRPARRGG